MHWSANEKNFQYALGAGVCYIWGFAAIRLSFVALYHRIFVHKWFKLVNKLLGCFLLAEAIEESLVLLFRCRPVYMAWTPGTVGYCVNLKAYYYASVRCCCVHVVGPMNGH